MATKVCLCRLHPEPAFDVEPNDVVPVLLQAPDPVTVPEDRHPAGEQREGQGDE